MPGPWFGPVHDLRRLVYREGTTRVWEYQHPRVESWGGPVLFADWCAIRGRFMVSFGQR